MKDTLSQPGWDAQAIRDIADKYYGGFAAMFDAHGWPERGSEMMPAQGRHVAQTYGDISAFVRAHEHGLSENYILNPIAAIEAAEPKVLLTSYFGFDPQNWPCLTFSDEGRLRTILGETRPGFLAVIYGAINAQVDPAMRGRVVGIYQLTHETGRTDDFLSPVGRKRKLDVQKDENSWNHAFRALRAWRVAPDSAPLISDFAHAAYSPERGMPISRYGTWLSREEALKILDLDLIPEPVFATDEATESVLDKGREALKPSRPGPVSQSSFMVREAEGPKHLYVLSLNGNADHFLGSDSQGCRIIKVGFSKSPATRCHAHNCVMPQGAFGWNVMKSTLAEGKAALPSSRHALAGEQEMIRLLAKSSQSLGGEFFLAEDGVIEDAWIAGSKKAGEFKS